MILHPEDLRLILRLLGEEGSRLDEEARYFERIGRLDKRNRAFERLAQIDRLRPIFLRTCRCIVREHRNQPGRPRKGCGKLEEGLIVS